MSKPEVIMLCGLTGSGKSTHAKQFRSQGYAKLSIDEAVHEKYGVADVDYPGEEYPQHEAVIKEELKKRLKKLLTQNKSVVLDYGFWKKQERDEYKKIIEDAGGKWRLVYFKAGQKVLLQRLRYRNTRNDANAFQITPEMLADFIQRFEEPRDEQEESIQQE